MQIKNLKSSQKGGEGGKMKYKISIVPVYCPNPTDDNYKSWWFYLVETEELKIEHWVLHKKKEYIKRWNLVNREFFCKDHEEEYHQNALEIDFGPAIPNSKNRIVLLIDQEIYYNQAYIYPVINRCEFEKLSKSGEKGSFFPFNDLPPSFLGKEMLEVVREFCEKNSKLLYEYIKPEI